MLIHKKNVFPDCFACSDTQNQWAVVRSFVWFVTKPQFVIISILRIKRIFTATNWHKSIKHSTTVTNQINNINQRYRRIHIFIREKFVLVVYIIRLCGSAGVQHSDLSKWIKIVNEICPTCKWHVVRRIALSISLCTVLNATGLGQQWWTVLKRLSNTDLLHLAWPLWQPRQKILLGKKKTMKLFVVHRREAC